MASTLTPPLRGSRWPWVEASLDTFTRFERVAYGSLIEPHHSSRRNGRLTFAQEANKEISHGH